ncbi:hypothetical protein [uncultured Vagococcus sp.]|uniref:hypothetical protein n=1 Tax=uncultured Vagococcus sp. TaxID=189676 RepID=UPI0028D5AB80|nr:hypothetical protein [uncultured Vagococcus sp.]
MLVEQLAETKKEVEQRIIRSIVASSALIQTETIKQRTKNSSSVIAGNTQKSTERLLSDLDNSLKGLWVAEAQQKLSENSQSMGKF